MCLGCGAITSREGLQRQFISLNPEWRAQAGAVAPDGDVFLEDEQVLSFRVPSCANCGGILKPEVTFFGDTVNKATVQFVHDRLAESDAVLVAGSSLQVEKKQKKQFTILSYSCFTGLLCLIVLSFPPRCTRGTGFYWQRVTGRCPLLS